MAYVLIVLLAVLIFLCISDVVQVITQATVEWERSRDLSKSDVPHKREVHTAIRARSPAAGRAAFVYGGFRR